MSGYINRLGQSRIQRQLRLRTPGRRLVFKHEEALAPEKTVRKSRAGPGPGGSGVPQDLAWARAPEPGRAGGGLRSAASQPSDRKQVTCPLGGLVSSFVT